MDGVDVRDMIPIDRRRAPRGHDPGPAHISFNKRGLATTGPAKGKRHAFTR